MTPDVMRIARRTVLLAAMVGCNGGPGPDPTPPPPRDWQAHPAIVTRAAPPTLYALSDVHGGYDRMVALLARHGLIVRVPASPAAIEWMAGDAVLVVVGDLIDKGPRGLEVITALQALEPRAAAAGGQLIVTLGNHEAEFFADPTNAKAESSDGIDPELIAQGEVPDLFSDGGDPRGAWLLGRPFAARVGDFFFAHGGDSHGRSLTELETLLETAVDRDGYRSPDLTGDTSLLEEENWYGDAAVEARYAANLGASHIVFGHDPHAIGHDGSIGQRDHGTLFRIDCGMSPDVDYSEGALLRVRFTNGETVDELRADGSVKHLWP